MLYNVIMKKLRLMSMIVFVPIVLGVGMLIGGSVTDNQTAASIGGWVLSAGIPVTMFVLVVVGLVLMITGKIDLSDAKKSSNGSFAVGNEQPDDEDEWEDIKDDDDEWTAAGDHDDEPKYVGVGKDSISVGDDDDEWEDVDEDDEQTDVGSGEDSVSDGARKKEYKQLSDINTSRGYDRKLKEAEYTAQHTSNAYKNSSPAQKVLGWLFFGFLITDFFMIMVFAFIGVFVGAIVCFCLFGGTILIALLVTVLRQKISMGLGVSKAKKRNAVDGKVLSCGVASTTTVNNRVTKVVYLVEMSDGEGEYSAYTEKYYDRGDNIKFCKIGKKLAMILDKEELDELDDEPLD